MKALTLSALLLLGCGHQEQVRKISVTPKATATPSPSPTPLVTPPPTPVPTAVPTARVVRVQPAQPTYAGSIPDLIRARFAPAGPQAVATALRVGSCESVKFLHSVVYGPATGRAGERGVFQAHPGHWDGRWNGKPRSHVHGYTFDDMFNPVKNIDWTYQHTNGGRNWGQWTCYRKTA